MEKSPFIKKSPEIKAYQFETFLGLFFWLQYDFIHKSPQKKSRLTSENAWFTILDFSFPRIYFLQDFFLRSYFLRLYWQPPYYFREKSPRNPKHRTVFPVTLFPRTWEHSDFFSKVFISRCFFQKLSFPGLSYIDSFPKPRLHN